MSRWDTLFDDPTRPLVVDVGCGMGVSVLGCAQLNSLRQDDHRSAVEESTMQLVDWDNCNFCGVDLNGLATQYAHGMVEKWDLAGRVGFVQDDALSFLQDVANTYPGSVELCLIQFPTPFRLEKRLPSDRQNNDSDDDGGGHITTPPEEFRGNQQLPASVTDGFMVSSDLLTTTKRALNPLTGKLLVQSNCEDVAVWIRETACAEAGFEAVGGDALEAFSCTARHEDSDAVVDETDRYVTTPTKRTLDWIAMGGMRAEGPGWSKHPLLPRSGRTETEVACMVNGTPVHRCLLVPT